MFKSSILFKIGVILVLISMLGGAPMSAAAAVVTLVWSPTTSPGSFDYGTLNSGDTSSQQFTLTDGRNSGVLTASLSGSPAFSITSDGCTGARLGRNPSCAVTVQYAPTGSGQSDTATLSASNKKGDSASITLTGTPVPCSLWGSASLEPQSGARLPQILELFASITNDCDVPLQYFWSCASPTSSDCDTFLYYANVAPYGLPNVQLTLTEFDVFDVSVYMCEIGTSNCTQQVNRQYWAIELQ